MDLLVSVRVRLNDKCPNGGKVAVWPHFFLTFQTTDGTDPNGGLVGGGTALVRGPVPAPTPSRRGRSQDLLPFCPLSTGRHWLYRAVSLPVPLPRPSELQLRHV